MLTPCRRSVLGSEDMRSHLNRGLARRRGAKNRSQGPVAPRGARESTRIEGERALALALKPLRGNSRTISVGVQRKVNNKEQLHIRVFFTSNSSFPEHIAMVLKMKNLTNLRSQEGEKRSRDHLNNIER